MRTVGHSRERCLIALRGYWDEIETLRDDLELLAEADRSAVRSCQVQFAQLVRDLDADIDARRASAAIVRMSEIEANVFLPTLRQVRELLADLSETPDRSWSEALSSAQDLLQTVSRSLARVAPSQATAHSSALSA